MKRYASFIAIHSDGHTRARVRVAKTPDMVGASVYDVEPRPASKRMIPADVGPDAYVTITVHTANMANMANTDNKDNADGSETAPFQIRVTHSAVIERPGVRVFADVVHGVLTVQTVRKTSNPSEKPSLHHPSSPPPGFVEGASVATPGRRGEVARTLALYVGVALACALVVIAAVVLVYVLMIRTRA